MPYNTDQALLSSPDPLNDSPTFSSPVKPHTSRARRSFPMQGSSPWKQTFQLDVGEQLSPQKIRVTVEAEHSNDNIIDGQRLCGDKNISSPNPYRAATVRQRVRTTTTSVPVKGLSDSEDDSFESTSQKSTRGRGRPRKSFGTPIPTKSRNREVNPGVKPSPRKRRTLGDLVDGDDPEDWDFAIGTGVEVSRGKGRSRSRSIKEVARNKSTPAVKRISSPDKRVSSTTSRKGWGRRKTLTPEEIIIHEDEFDAMPNVSATDDDQGLCMKGMLTQRDMNLIPAQSACSATLPSTTVRNHDPDVLLTKFSPAKKTPAQAGWFNPGNTSASITSTLSEADYIPRRTTLFGQSRLQCDTDGKDGTSDRYQNDHTSGGIHENENGEFREFDTILESEGFSMISVDSVPSLREHLSSPARPNQSGEKNESTTVDGNVSLLKNDSNAFPEDSFSSIAPEILQAASPRKNSSNPLLRAVLSPNIPGDKDSCSSISPEVLGAAASGKQRPRIKLLSIKGLDYKSNDDSFSSIPPAILEAATPAKPVQTQVIKPNAQSRPTERLNSVTNLAILSSFSLLETGKRSLTSSGLLTPNETPSPPEMAVQQLAITNHGDRRTVSESEHCKIPLVEGSSIVKTHIRSSPPSAGSHGVTYTGYPRQSQSLHINSIETPSMVFSSPSLPPLIQQLPLNRSRMSSKMDIDIPLRQSLSPIVRAGRVLQDIAMTSTSRNRTQGLGSPFKSPAAQHSSSGASIDYSGSSGVSEKSQKSSEKSKGKDGSFLVGFSDDTQRELQRGLMMGEELDVNQNPGAETVNLITVVQEDPFCSGNQSTRSPSPEESKEYTLELPIHKARPYSRVERDDWQYQDSLGSESAMSWQAESAVPVSTVVGVETNASNRLEDGISETTEFFERRREAEWARQRAAVSSQIESASPSKVIVIESDGEEDPLRLSGKVDEEQEEDIWQAEARHSSSLSEGQSSNSSARQEPSEKPRRSKIPSPWRQNSKRLVYSDELAQLSSPQQPEKLNRLPSNVQIKPKPNAFQTAVRKRSLTRDVGEEEEEELPETSIMWHIPQKLNFTPRSRRSGNLDLSALLASSPLKMPQSASQIHSKPGPVSSDVSRGDVSKFTDIELAVPASNTPNEGGSQDYNEELQSVDNNFQHQSSAKFTITNYEGSELVSESSHTEFRVQYPTLPNTISPSPQKSCLRTPTSASPTKSVAFVSPASSPPPLSATIWSKAHWKLLSAIYRDSKSISPISSKAHSENGHKTNDESSEGAMEPSKYLGRTINARGISLTLELWHLDIVHEFREEVPGWDEGVIAKRLFAIIAGEDFRRRGKE